MRLMRGTDPRAGSDAGTTMMELVVAMSVFAVVMSVVMGGMMSLTSATRQQNVRSTATDQVWRTYTNLDRQVRYAESVNLPGTGPSGDTYVEFRLNGAAARSGLNTCVQWRYDPVAGTLARRSWTDVAGVSVPAFATVSSGVLPAAAGTSAPYPFQVILATTANPHQQLVLRMRVGNGTGTPVSEQTTFDALNSSTNSVSNTDTSPADGQSDIPVCLTAAGRP